MGNSLVNDYRSMSSDDRKLIYVVNVNDDNGDWKVYDNSLKIGDATISDLNLNLSNNSEDLRKAANKRISSYLVTSGIPYNIDWAELAYRKGFSPQWFRDYDVHKVLKRSGIKHNPKLSNGREWYMTDVETVKKAIFAVKNGELAINVPEDKEQIELRPEQKEAVKKTKTAFKKYNRFLWNAKMRFGKTLTAFQLVREEHYQKVLIITHRPVVSDGWFDDFRKIDLADDGYEFGSKNKGKSLFNLNASDNPFVYFASIQDLAGSEVFGGKVGDKNRLAANINWDLIIIDEAHEGTQTDLSQRVLDGMTKSHTKLLELSGTPFNILDQYADDQVFTWDYVMEQEAKNNWSKEHQNQDNPYAGLPKVSMFTFEMKDKFKQMTFKDVYKQSFNFKEFFRVDSDDNFVYKDKVSKFLDNITSPSSRTNYPFSTRTFRNNLRHTLWILPGVKEARALKKLMDQHPIFGSEYNVVNVVDNGDDTVASDSDLDRVRKAIGDKPYNTKTITLTVRKLTTGVTVKEWSGVVFLSNTNSPMQYLQAAFRAQTPYSDITGSKINCYIFDFAPDRALTIMAGTTDVSTKVGHINTTVQKDNMRKLLNFLPIIGEDNQGMKRFNIDSLLTKMKMVYAEKAVKNGFDDDSIYNDELLKLDNADLAEFKKLKEIIKSSILPRLPKKIDINKNGLTDEEYRKSENGKKKPKRERTPEEQAAIDKINALRKQRKTMVSILRAISIRIPLMIYGLNVPIAKDVEINTFVDSVDDKSWEEFMPKDVTKELFKNFSKYYDSQVFLEAGRIIRQKVISIDKDDPIERAHKLMDIFSTFKNPDKETVLTPWRVISMQLGKTIGGYSFYDDNYEYTSVDGRSASHWNETSVTKNVFSLDSRVLDINSKTGLYPLYSAISIYYLRLQKLNNDNAGKFDYYDEMKLWNDILQNNVFAIAKTPMARDIAIRTLTGYQHNNVNVYYIEDLVETLRTDLSLGKNLLLEKMKKIMKFNAIVGNPPYTSNDNGAGSSGKPIYQLFTELAKKLDPDYISFITPSRWFVGGKGLNDYREEMLNDTHLKEVYDWLTPQDIFPGTNIRGGVSFFLWDKRYDNHNTGIRMVTYKNNKLISDENRPLKIKGVNILIRDNVGVKIITNKLNGHLDNNMSNHISSRKPFGLSTTFNHFTTKTDDTFRCVTKGNVVKHIDKKFVTNNIEWAYEWKILTSRANNIGTELNDDNLNTIISSPGEICTETYLVVGADLNLNKSSSENVSKYMHTKFFRFLHSLAKGGQDATSKTYMCVPMQDFSDNSDIKWNCQIEQIDDQLFDKYELSNSEIEHIKKSIK